MRKTLTFKYAMDQLPKANGEYLCFIDDEWIVLSFSSKHQGFNTMDYQPDEEAKKTAIKVTYWAALPKIGGYYGTN